LKVHRKKKRSDGLFYNNNPIIADLWSISQAQSNNTRVHTRETLVGEERYEGKRSTIKKWGVCVKFGLMLWTGL